MFLSFILLTSADAKDCHGKVLPSQTVVAISDVTSSSCFLFRRKQCSQRHLWKKSDKEFPVHSQDYLNLHVRVLWTHLELIHSLFAELGDLHHSWGTYVNCVQAGMRGHHLLMVLPSWELRETRTSSSHPSQHTSDHYFHALFKQFR